MNKKRTRAPEGHLHRAGARPEKPQDLAAVQALHFRATDGKQLGSHLQTRRGWWILGKKKKNCPLTTRQL